MDSKYFNANWLCRVDYGEIHCLVGFKNLVDLLDDAAPRVFARLEAHKGEKLTVRPFHGMVITFYVR